MSANVAYRMALAAALTALWSGVPAAQDRDDFGQDRSAAQAPAERQFDGEVVGIRTIEQPGTGETAMILDMDTDDGRRIVVDLGPVRNLDNIGFERGDRARVQGHFYRTDQVDPVLVATRVRANGATADIGPRSTPLRPRADQASDDTWRVISGRPVTVRQVTRPGSEAQHTIVVLETAQGESVRVDLGPERNLQGVELGSGQSIEIRGRELRRGDDVMIVADRVRMADREWEQRRQEVDEDREAFLRGEDSPRIVRMGGRTYPMDRDDMLTDDTAITGRTYPDDGWWTDTPTDRAPVDRRRSVDRY